MADENNAGAVAEIAVTDTPVKVRRTRGPNKPKPTVDAAKVTSAEVQTAPVKTAAVRRRKQVETEGVASRQPLQSRLPSALQQSLWRPSQQP